MLHPVLSQALAQTKTDDLRDRAPAPRRPPNPRSTNRLTARAMRLAGAGRAPVRAHDGRSGAASGDV